MIGANSQTTRIKLSTLQVDQAISRNWKRKTALPWTWKWEKTPAGKAFRPFPHQL